MLDHDVTRTVRFAPLAGETGRAVLARHVTLPNGLDSLVLVDVGADGAERVRWYSEAVLGLLDGLTGPWPWMAWFARVIPRFLRDAGYRAFAASRYSVFGRQESCRLVDEADEHRFLP